MSDKLVDNLKKRSILPSKNQKTSDHSNLIPSIKRHRMTKPLIPLALARDHAYLSASINIHLLYNIAMKFIIVCRMSSEFLEIRFYPVPKVPVHGGKFIHVNAIWGGCFRIDCNSFFNNLVCILASIKSQSNFHCCLFVLCYVLPSPLIIKWPCQYAFLSMAPDKSLNNFSISKK